MFLDGSVQKLDSKKDSKAVKQAKLITWAEGLMLVISSIYGREVDELARTRESSSANRVFLV